MCLLVNFRDLQPSKKRSGIQESEVKQCVIGILQQNAQILPSNDQLLLQFGTTSLYNCFGLSTLHHFIYNTYLRAKRNELQQQLLEVHEEMSRSQETSPRMKYKDFLKILGDEVEEKRKKTSKKHHAKATHNLEPTNTQSSAQHQDNPDGIHANESNGDISEQPQQQPHRRNIVSKANAPPPAQTTQAQSPSCGNTKDALEAFLASDDDEEVTLVKKPRQRGQATYDDDDDDDDDDFFYDEEGERCTVHNGNKAIPSPQAKASGSSSRKDLERSSQSARTDEPARESIRDEHQPVVTGDSQPLPPSTTSRKERPGTESFHPRSPTDVSEGSLERPGEPPNSDDTNRASKQQQPTVESVDTKRQKAGDSGVEDACTDSATVEVVDSGAATIGSVGNEEPNTSAPENDSAEQTALKTKPSLDKDDKPEAAKEVGSDHDGSIQSTEDNTGSGKSEQIIGPDKIGDVEDTNEAEDTKREQDDDHHAEEPPAEESRQEEASSSPISPKSTENGSNDGSDQNGDRKPADSAESHVAESDSHDAFGNEGGNESSDGKGNQDNTVASRKSAPVSSQQVVFDSDDEDEFFVDESAIGAPLGDSDEDDDDEFFVGEEHAEKIDEVAKPLSESAAKLAVVETAGSSGETDEKADDTSTAPKMTDEPGNDSDQAEPSQAQETARISPTGQHPEPVHRPVATPAFSSSVQAAIAAAQREAELMLQQSQAAASADKSMKKEKKKEKKEKKAKKEKKKEKKAKRKEQQDSDD